MSKHSARFKNREITIAIEGWYLVECVEELFGGRKLKQLYWDFDANKKKVRQYELELVVRRRQ